MPASKVQLIGGHFQDSEGNALANGYLTMFLSQDGTVTGVANICAGIEITIQLDVNGTVVTSPAQFIWGNDVILPVNTYYKVTGYSAAGQPAWGPNIQQVASGSTFDVGTWTPGQIISWIPPSQQVLPSYTVAGLPAGIVGQLAYASNGLKVGETTGNGTGVPVYFSAGLWRVFSTDAQVSS
jgi:hypothetical protein